MKKCPSNFVMVGILIENCINPRQFSVRIFLRSDIHVKWWTRLGTLCLTHAAYNLRQIFSGSIFVHIISSGSCNVCLCHFPIFYDHWQNYFRSCRVRLTVGPFSSLFITFSLFKCCWSNSTRQHSPRSAALRFPAARRLPPCSALMFWLVTHRM